MAIERPSSHHDSDWQLSIDIDGIVKRVYRRVNKLEKDAPFPPSLFQECLAYYNGIKIYTAEKMSLEEFREMFENRDCIELMTSVWESINNDFARLALRILSTVANSGANERAFSVMGRTYSDKTRNQLSPERAHKSLITRKHVNETYPYPKTRKRRRLIPYHELLGGVGKAKDSAEVDEVDKDADEEVSTKNVGRVADALDDIPDDDIIIPDETRNNPAREGVPAELGEEVAAAVRTTRTALREGCRGLQAGRNLRHAAAGGEVTVGWFVDVACAGWQENS
ncbi:hypothetical protein B0H14DRAFT_3692791 [Mycena olivaceomarginata]|nr:hypothetical protein B0H14DRAFT_3692791 [Mycena olivaceomarginata]